MNIRLLILLLTYAVLPGGTLKSRTLTPDSVTAVIRQLREQYAPDKRTALFSVSAEKDSNAYVLKGVTTLPEVRQLLLATLHREGLTVKDSIHVYPDSTLHGKNYGLVNLSVICMRSGPDYMDGLDTQTLLGSPVRLLEKKNWWHIQSADDYLGWTHYTSIVPLTREELENWNRSPKVVVTAIQTYGYSRPDKQSQIVSDLIAGNRLRLLKKKGKFYRIAYPDGREAWLPVQDAMEETKWLASRRPDAAHLIATARTLMGFPYLWGGTSVKGMDCSGFVKTCAFLNGLILARDASQMAYSGKRYASTDYHNWKPGDLLFFGKPAADGKKARVSHVGLYIGNGRFIHSMGYVHISSLNPEDTTCYDAFNKSRFLWAVNILDHTGTPGIRLVKDTPLYQEHIKDENK